VAPASGYSEVLVAFARVGRLREHGKRSLRWPSRLPLSRRPSLNAPLRRESGTADCDFPMPSFLPALTNSTANSSATTNASHESHAPGQLGGSGSEAVQSAASGDTGQRRDLSITRSRQQRSVPPLSERVGVGCCS
jgi:hypothetical protein